MMSTRIISFVLILFGRAFAQGSNTPFLEPGQSYSELKAKAAAIATAGVNSRITILRVDVALSGARCEFWRLDDTCGSGGCQYFILEKSSKTVKFIGDFFGRYKILEQSTDGFKHISVQTESGDGKINYTLTRKAGGYYK
jgi:hypothetical protein